jgi:hypothetical protein
VRVRKQPGLTWTVSSTASVRLDTASCKQQTEPKQAPAGSSSTSGVDSGSTATDGSSKHRDQSSQTPEPANRETRVSAEGETVEAARSLSAQLAQAEQGSDKQETTADALLAEADGASDIWVQVTAAAEKRLLELPGSLPRVDTLEAVGDAGKAALLRAVLRPAVSALLSAPQPTSGRDRVHLLTAVDRLLSATCQQLQAAFISKAGGDMAITVEALRICAARPTVFAQAVINACKDALAEHPTLCVSSKVILRPPSSSPRRQQSRSSPPPPQPQPAQPYVPAGQADLDDFASSVIASSRVVALPTSATIASARERAAKLLAFNPGQVSPSDRSTIRTAVSASSYVSSGTRRQIRAPYSLRQPQQQIRPRSKGAEFSPAVTNPQPAPEPERPKPVMRVSQAEAEEIGSRLSSTWTKSERVRRQLSLDDAAARYREASKIRGVTGVKSPPSASGVLVSSRREQAKHTSPVSRISRASSPQRRRVALAKPSVFASLAKQATIAAVNSPPPPPPVPADAHQHTVPGRQVPILAAVLRQPPPPPPDELVSPGVKSRSDANGGVMWRLNSSPVARFRVT